MEHRDSKTHDREEKTHDPLPPDTILLEQEGDITATLHTHHEPDRISFTMEFRTPVVAHDDDASPASTEAESDDCDRP